MLRALEIFWLSLMIFCGLAALFAFYAYSPKEGLLILLCTAVAGLKYYTRRKQRIAEQRKK